MGDFVLKHLMRNVNTFEINIPIFFPHLVCAFFMSQHPSIMSAIDIVFPEPKTMALSFRLFQGTDVPDLSSSFFPSQGGSRSSSSNVPLSFDNLVLSSTMASRVL